MVAEATSPPSLFAGTKPRKNESGYENLRKRELPYSSKNTFRGCAKKDRLSCRGATHYYGGPDTKRENSLSDLGWGKILGSGDFSREDIPFHLGVRIEGAGPSLIWRSKIGGEVGGCKNPRQFSSPLDEDRGL